MSKCKSCGAEITWAITDGGKRIPLDPKPISVAIPLPDKTVRIYKGYESHFATCPNATAHRRPRTAPRGERKHGQRGNQCGMCPNFVVRGQPNTAVVSGIVLCGPTCLEAYRAKTWPTRGDKS